MGSEARGLWCYLLFRMRFVQGDFVGGGRDGAQTNRIGTGIALLIMLGFFFS
jgi:hypothetical protein